MVAVHMTDYRPEPAPDPPAVRALTDLCEGRKRAPSLRVLARFINEWCPDLEASVARSHVSTDRKPRGCRHRIPGKGRVGNRLDVYAKGDRVTPIWHHDGAETYRRNGEAVAWVAKRIGHPDPLHFETRWRTA